MTLNRPITGLLILICLFAIPTVAFANDTADERSAGAGSDTGLREVIPPKQFAKPDGEVIEQPYDWELSEPRDVRVKSTALTVRELVRTAIWFPSPGSGPEERAREGLADLRRAGMYRPELPI